MFGIIHALFTGGVLAADGIRTTAGNAERRELARQRGDLTYYDVKNQKRLVSNDRLVFNGMVNGDEVVKDFKNGKIYANLSLEKRQRKRKEDIEKAERENRTILYYFEKQKDFVNEEWYDCLLEFNEDIQTKHPVHSVNINNKWFIMDLTNGKLLREAMDNDINVNHHYLISLNNKANIIYDDLDSEDIIRIFNERQDKIDKSKISNKYNSYDLHLKSYYYLQLNKAFIINNKVIVGYDEKKNKVYDQTEWYDVKGE